MNNYEDKLPEDLKGKINRLQEVGVTVKIRLMEEAAEIPYSCRIRKGDFSRVTYGESPADAVASAQEASELKELLPADDA